MSVINQKKMTPKPPTSSKLIGNISRKRRLVSQQTIDTNTTEIQQTHEKQKMNQEQVMLEIKQSLQIIEKYWPNMLVKKSQISLKEDIQWKQRKVDDYVRQIGQIEDEISRLKEVYHRPQKVSAPTRNYTQLHLKSFTLADQIAKKRQHLELHINHHATLKAKAKQLHQQLKQILPRYLEQEKKRGFKPLSYGQFRKKALAEKRQNVFRSKIRSISQRSFSRRSSKSVKSIIEQNSNCEVSGEKKNLWYMQKRKRVATLAHQAAKQKHNKELDTLQEQLKFLRGQDQQLTKKIQQLNKEVSSYTQSFTATSTNLIVSPKISKVNR